jgi:hypothetical protein
MADTLYSLTLLLSLAAGGAAILFAGIGRWGAAGESSRWRRRQGWSSAVSGGALVVSFGVHLAFGHTPGSDRALGVGEFLGEHPSFLFAAALPLLAWIPWTTRRGMRTS